MLANSYKLDRCQSDDWRVVNVVADLTYQQRKYETTMKNDALAKNLERTEGEMRDRLAWKVLGKRVAKRRQQVVMCERERVDRFGNMVEEGDLAEDRRKRRRSGGSSHQQRDKRGKVQGADFGTGGRLEMRK